MKAKFTSGEWSYRGKLIEQVNSVDGQLRMRLIAMIDETCAEHRANARLIAAAPRLYRALEAVVDALDLTLKAWHECEGVTIQPSELALIAEARAALAQADGGEG